MYWKNISWDSRRRCEASLNLRPLKIECFWFRLGSSCQWFFFWAPSAFFADDLLLSISPGSCCWGRDQWSGCITSSLFYKTALTVISLACGQPGFPRSEEHTSELQSLR